MRRRTPGAIERDALLAKKIARMEREDPERVISVLERFVNERRRERMLEVIHARLGSVEVMFESPHDPFNGAAVIRSCEAFGVQRLRVIETREKFLAATSVARGSHKWIDVISHPDAASAIDGAKKNGMELIATAPDGELVPEDLSQIPRFSLVLGNEREGIGDALRASCSRAVKVPMRGFVESLNVSVTAAILLSRACEKRPGDLAENDRRRLYARGLYFSVSRADELLRDS
ncbi:MAG: TrmH family RNA methyltransferase [Polyangiaceae bacterium]